MLRRYVEQILKIYNCIDDIMVTDEKGIVSYVKIFRPDVNYIKEEDVLGKHVLEVFPTLSEETSSILRVLKYGKPICNEYQNIETFEGKRIRTVNSTYPIVNKNDIIGAVDFSRYIDPDIKMQSVFLSIDDNQWKNNKSKTHTIEDLITNSPKMTIIKERIEKISKTDSSVIIYGKTGTGKELVAQAIHSSGKRYNKPFISQNCAAIPSSLLESILFGTVKGSYTGAEDRAGLFELANGGTIFLDEINSMEYDIQSKILKVVEDKRVKRVGGKDYIDIDVRIISALNENPFFAIEQNKLREDLFYRLGVVQVTLPTLNERKEDILLLTNYFIKKFNHEMKKNIIGISEKVEEIFMEYSWNGNVRELKNVIECAFNLSSSNLIEEKDLPEYLLNSQKNKDNLLQIKLGEESLSSLVDNFEKRLIIKALKETNSKTEAAEILKISKQSLKYKLDKYKL